MKNNLQVGELEDILRFCDYRNHFLVKKCIQMKKYITNINRIITFFDSIDEIEEIESIDVKLRMMLISLCLELPVEVFGEPYWFPFPKAQYVLFKK